MQHFPIFVSVAGRRIVLSGGGEAALAKLRLLLKTEAHLTVFATDPAPQIETWSTEGRLTLIRRAMGPGDALCAVAVYGANENRDEDLRTAAIARADGALVNIVDDLEHSDFITPAIVDRDPVTVAIGTEGAAPVLARAIKADIEARLSPAIGTLARIGKSFRRTVEALPAGRARRDFWGEYYRSAGPRAATGGEPAIRAALYTLLARHMAGTAREGQVSFVGAGPGDPELLTLKARRALDEADVVIHDRLISPPILELARREAILIDAGKEGFGAAMDQAEINALIVTMPGGRAGGAPEIRRRDCLRPPRRGNGRLRRGRGRLRHRARHHRRLRRCGRTRAEPDAARAQRVGAVSDWPRHGRFRRPRLDDTGAARVGCRDLHGQTGGAFIQGRLIMHGAERTTPVTWSKTRPAPTSASCHHSRTAGAGPGRCRDHRPGAHALWPRPARGGRAVTHSFAKMESA
jgi:uroporphyrin-III C-methyltransferase/precorrin-2 dehydrogenase/sirohydrochlorin ferrochelatase